MAEKEYSLGLSDPIMWDLNWEFIYDPDYLQLTENFRCHQKLKLLISIYIYIYIYIYECVDVCGCVFIHTYRWNISGSLKSRKFPKFQILWILPMEKGRETMCSRRNCWHSSFRWRWKTHLEAMTRYTLKKYISSWAINNLGHTDLWKVAQGSWSSLYD